MENRQPEPRILKSIFKKRFCQISLLTEKQRQTIFCLSLKYTTYQSLEKKIRNVCMFKQTGFLVILVLASTSAVRNFFDTVKPEMEITSTNGNTGFTSSDENLNLVFTATENVGTQRTYSLSELLEAVRTLFFFLLFRSIFFFFVSLIYLLLTTSGNKYLE